MECLNYLYQNDIKVNNEFYADSTIEAGIKLGYKTRVFVVDKYVCFGTPDDYKTFVSYQSLFHKLKYHPYTLDKDINFNQEKFEQYDKKYRDFKQENI